MLVCSSSPPNQTEKSKSQRLLSEFTFVITGTLITPPDDYKALIESYGGKVVNTVSKNTSYLIAGEAPGASKFNKANTLGIQILDEKALNNLIRNRQ